MLLKSEKTKKLGKTISPQGPCRSYSGADDITLTLSVDEDLELKRFKFMSTLKDFSIMLSSVYCC